MIRILAALLLLSIPLSAEAQFKRPEIVNDKNIPLIPKAGVRYPGMPYGYFDLPEDARFFVGKEKSCAEYIAKKKEFSDNPTLLAEFDSNFAMIECNMLPCERQLILDKYQSNEEVLKTVYTYTDTSVKEWFPGGTNYYYAQNVCTTPLDPAKPMPINPYAPDFYKRTEPKKTAKNTPQDDLTDEQVLKVMDRVGKLDPTTINDSTINKIVEDVKAGN